MARQTEDTITGRPTDSVSHALAPTEPDVLPNSIIHVCKTCGINAIQEAIETATPGTIIRVAEGNYSERLVMTKSLTLEGGWNTDFTHRDVNISPTRVDGQGTGTVVSIASTSLITIDGFWITGGNSPTGGGIRIVDAQAVIRHNVISGNLTSTGADEGSGGGIYTEGSDTIVLLDANAILSNTAVQGGGVMVNGTAGLTMTNNMIGHNVAVVGGGVYASSPGVLHIVNNTFVQNAPSAIVAQDSAPIVVNNIVVSHVVGISATADGSAVLLTHNLFYANGQNYAGALTAMLPDSDLVADPLFTSDYHLWPLSPAIDRGIAWIAPFRDFDGQPRPVGEVDIGADEAGTVLYIPSVSRQFTPGARNCCFGVGIWPPQAIPEQIDQAQELGICWSRASFYWDTIEPVKTAPRTYDWQDTDQRIISMTMAGVNPIGLVFANPTWAAQYPGGPVTDTQDLLDFLAAAAERYDGDGFLDAPGSPVVQMWELYNEPDNQSLYYAQRRGWGYWGGRGDEYAQLLAQARIALRSANPTAQLAFGGLAHEYGGDIFDMGFPGDVFAYIQAHPGYYFDFFNFHFFPVFAAAYQDWGPDIIGKTNYFHDLMNQYDVSWPMIVTEAGYWSSSPYPEPWKGNYEDQARYVVQLYSRSIAADLDVVLWLLLFDLPVHDADRGLSNVNGIPKPAYNAYKTAMEKLGDLSFDRLLSPAELGTEHAEGYAFKRAGGSYQLYVIWTTDLQTKSAFRIAAPSVVVSDKVVSQWPMSPTIPYFASYSVLDSDDGVPDGYTEIPFDNNPIYVEVIP
jgi:hypothetical protein